MFFIYFTKNIYCIFDSIELYIILIIYLMTFYKRNIIRYLLLVHLLFIEL